ncbi:MAG: glycine cleavage system protein H [Chlorobiaceae bacterium]|nr:glycine cleavage system protein H [Chlorobiaceae bacterium]MBA4308845.1 glycine cleavage system protein H [Chlorobiaceae bacterium]
MNIPENLKYTVDHEWISIEGNVGTIGITEYAQGELGDIVFVDINPKLESLTKGAIFGTIEAVKTVSELFAPCNGKVLEINSALADSPDLINRSAYEDGWIIKIQIEDSENLSSLLSAEEYRTQIGK